MKETKKQTGWLSSGQPSAPHAPSPPTLSTFADSGERSSHGTPASGGGTTPPPAYQSLEIQWQGKPKELELARPLLGKLIQHRTGHGDFGQYHRRWNHLDAELSCSCGREKTPVHFYFCKRVRRRAGVHDTVDWVLGTAEGAFRWAEVMCETSFFQDICPHRWALSPPG